MSLCFFVVWHGNVESGQYQVCCCGASFIPVVLGGPPALACVWDCKVLHCVCALNDSLLEMVKKDQWYYLCLWENAFDAVTF